MKHLVLIRASSIFTLRASLTAALYKAATLGVIGLPYFYFRAAKRLLVF